MLYFVNESKLILNPIIFCLFFFFLNQALFFLLNKPQSKVSRPRLNMDPSGIGGINGKNTTFE